MRLVPRPGWDIPQTVLCVLAAFTIAGVVRPVTAEFTDIAGHVWPFSLVHCESRSAPGCVADERVVTHRVPPGLRTSQSPAAVAAARRPG